MNATLLTGPLAQAIGWALLHLLWQATIVAGILAAVLSLIPRQSANARYGAACGALAVVFTMFIATAWRSYDPYVPPVVSAEAETQQPAKITINQVPVVLATIAAETWRDRMIEIVARARQTLPSVVAVWLAGVVFLSSRLLIGWMRARRLAHRGPRVASVEWQRVARRLSDALGLRRAVQLLESAAVEVPSVIGTLRPIILLPASTLTGLTPQQIEMVLAHELAHIRRHDFLVNLLQAVVETLMFYHPAVWWMSRRVRIERENCCDDMAVAVCGNPIQYARALTRLEELRSAPSLMVAANGGSLLDRIRRIAGVRAESNGVSARWAAAMITLVILAIGISVPSLPAFADREETPKAKSEKKANEAKAKVDVTAKKVDDDEAIAMSVDDEDVDSNYDSDSDDNYDEAAPEPEEEVMVMPAVEPRVRVIAGTPAPARPTVTVMPALAPTPRPAPVAAVAALAPAAWADDEDEDEDEPRSTKKIGSAKLTVDELIGLKAVGVTPEYIDSMRAIFGDITVSEVKGLRALSVTAEYIRDMRAAGLAVDSPRTASNLRALSVTADYIRDMRAAGVNVTDAKEATPLKAVGVSVEFVRQLAAAGYGNLTVKELTRMAAVGIDAKFIRDMEKYRDKKN
jgi:beta-lactamase regulating signal transducer with metallopeptidase domain